MIQFGGMKHSPLSQAIWFTGAVILIHAGLLFSGAYAIAHVDTVMHFLGGFAMALFGIAIHHGVSSKHHSATSPWWYHYLFVVGFAMLIGVAWEFHEYIFDQTVHVWLNMPTSQISLADTMKDFLFDWIGASVAFYFKRTSV